MEGGGRETFVLILLQMPMKFCQFEGSKVSHGSFHKCNFHEKEGMEKRGLGRGKDKMG